MCLLDLLNSNILSEIKSKKSDNTSFSLKVDESIGRNLINKHSWETESDFTNHGNTKIESNQD